MPTSNGEEPLKGKLKNYSGGLCIGHIRFWKRKGWDEFQTILPSPRSILRQGMAKEMAPETCREGVSDYGFVLPTSSEADLLGLPWSYQAVDAKNGSRQVLAYLRKLLRLDMLGRGQ